MSGFEASIHVSGTLLVGNATGEINTMVSDVKAAVADQASAEVHHVANVSFRHPTPYYEAQIHRFRRSLTEVVGDRGVVYGPWLEGTGSRNRTTRFKGYHLWRIGTERARAAVGRLSRPIVDRCVRSLRS